MIFFYLMRSSNKRSKVVISMHELFQSLSPLVDGRINNILLQTVPDINKALLQLTDAIQLILVFIRIKLK